MENALKLRLAKEMPEASSKFAPYSTLWQDETKLMHSSQKKADLITALTELVPVWDFAKHLVFEISENRIPDADMDELCAIVSDAVKAVNESGQREKMQTLRSKASLMLEHEKAQERHERDATISLLNSL